MGPPPPGGDPINICVAHPPLLGFPRWPDPAGSGGWLRGSCLGPCAGRERASVSGDSLTLGVCSSGVHCLVAVHGGWVCAVMVHMVMCCHGLHWCLYVHGWLAGSRSVMWSGIVHGCLAGCVHGCVAGCLSGSLENQGDFRRQIPASFQRIFALKIAAKNPRDFRADFRLI